MNQVNSAIRLLILNDSRSEAERLMSMLRNAGRPARAKHIDDEEKLNKVLLDDVWDLMIGLDSTQNLKPINAIKLIRKLNKDVPVILQTDEDGNQARVEGLKVGAVDVIQMDEDQHLLLVIQRELSNREMRDRRRFAERRFREIERRNQQLLDSSRDAIAFVQDGMFLYVNDSFAELFEFPAKDDLECMPVIDVIKEVDHSKVKRFMKEFAIKGSEIDSTSLEFTGLLANDTEKLFKIEVRMAAYDEETCIQFLVRDYSTNNEELEAQLAQIKNQDIATGTYNKNYLIEQLENVVDKAINSLYNSALFHIGIEDFFGTVQTKLGATSADIVLGEIASKIHSLITKNDTLCRFNDDTFALLVPRIDATTAQTRADELCAKLRDHVVDIDGATLHFHFHIGIALINETTANSDIPINHAVKALDLVRQEAASNAEVLSSIFEPELPKEAKADLSKMVQRALDQGRFRILYQPLLSLRGSEKEHYEVFIRMRDDNGEEVSPADFIAAAAKIGATTKIDRWVILESIKQLSEHRAQGHNTRLVINLCRESLLDKTLPPWLGVAFKAAGLPAEALIFQLNEADINDHLNVAKTFTEQVTKLGADCSISHFGCALNPFNALKSVAVSLVKLDGSFTQDLQKNTESTSAMNEVIGQLHEAEKLTLVPFVENSNILSKLWQSGVHFIQGYYVQGPNEKMDYDFDMES